MTELIEFQSYAPLNVFCVFCASIKLRSASSYGMSNGNFKATDKEARYELEEKYKEQKEMQSINKLCKEEVWKSEELRNYEQRYSNREPN